MTLDDVRREALHDWLAERPPLERPDRCEYEEDRPWRGAPAPGDEEQSGGAR